MSARPEQLLFGSVDLMVDGVEHSGWQIVDCSSGLTDPIADDLVRLIDPELTPVKPLPGFPTAEEVRAADRRLVHRRIAGAPVLLHTAPAGLDTTGRPNSLTHVVVDGAENTARPLLGPGTWRAPWWCTPFGPEQVRAARIPAPSELKPGTAVTSDSALAHILQPGVGAALGQLADVLARNEERAETDERELALLLVDSVDEAAQHLGALLSCTAPEAARSVSWSTLERVRGDRDLQRLRSSGLDIAAVPRTDITEQIVLPQGCVLVDPERPSAEEPSTPFGRFVAAMAADPGLWLAAHEAMAREVLSQLVDQSGITLAWPLAMVQARAWFVHGPETQELFARAYSGHLRRDVESVLLRADIPSLDLALPGMAEDLRGARSALIGEANQRSPQEWRELCHRIADSLTPERAQHFGLLYLRSAIAEPSWLLRMPGSVVALPDPLRAALTEWSTTDPEAAALLDDALRTLDVAARDGASGTPVVPLAAGAPSASELSPGTARARLAAGLLEDGLQIEATALDDLLSLFAQEVLAAANGAAPGTPTDPREQIELIAALPLEARSALAALVEKSIDERALGEAASRGVVHQPVLAPLLAQALAADSAHDLPWLSLQSALGASAAGEDPAAQALESLLVPAQRIASGAAGATLRLAAEPAAALESTVTVSHLDRLAALPAATVPQAERWMLLAVLSDPLDERARTALLAQRQTTPAIAEAQNAPVTASTWQEDVVLLAEAAASPFLTQHLTRGQTWAWAENVHAAAHRLAAAVPTLPESQHLRALLNDLAGRSAHRSAATLILLSTGSQRFSLDEARYRLDFDGLIAAAKNRPSELLTPCTARWGRAGLDTLRTVAALPEGTALPTQLAAAAVLEARLRGAPQAEVQRMIDDARAEFKGDGPGWDRAQRAVPSLREGAASRTERLSGIVKKNLNLLSWQRKEGRDG